MSFRDDVRRHVETLSAGSGGGGSVIASRPVIGAGMPSGFYAGCYRDPVTNARGPEIWLPWLDMVLICGAPRMGKDTGLIIPNALLSEGNISQVFQDTRLEAAAIALPYCKIKGPAYIANAFDVMVDIYPDLRSDRANLLKTRAINPKNPRCFENLCALVEAMIPHEGGNNNNPFFPLKAQELCAGVGKGELITSAREGRDPSFLRVRKQITEAEEFDKETGELKKGLRATVRRLFDEGDEQINSLLGDFAGGQYSDGIRDAIATFGAYTRWALSPAIAREEQNPQIDFARLGEVPSTLFYGVPHELVEAFAPYYRLFTTALLQPLFAPHDVPVRIFLNEFTATGRVPAVQSAIGLVAGCKIQIVIVVQSLAQLRAVYGEGWEVFFAAAGAKILVGSADEFSANYLAAHTGEMTLRQPNVGLNLNPGGIGLSSGEAYGRRQYLMPQDLRNVRRREGYIWLSGLNDPIPAMFPPYYDNPLRPELKLRGRANPYL
jgi:type IV secretory pathway TraG/TraD family ATPase VirD4